MFCQLLRLEASSPLSLLLLQVNIQQQHSELSELMGDFGLDNAKGKGIAADHAIEQQFAQSEHDLQQANERVTAVNAAIGELQNLEDFIRTTKPPREEAVTLTEEIVRQLLERLNFLRLDFAVPKQVWVVLMVQFCKMQFDDTKSQSVCLIGSSAYALTMHSRCLKSQTDLA